MKYLAYSVLDNAVGTYSTPFFVAHKQYAMRYFETLARDEKSDISKYPSQFHLFEVGTFDDGTGVFELHQPPVSFGLASSFLNQE